MPERKTYKINKKGCWIWQGTCNNIGGYGQIHLKKGVLIRAHRYYYELYYGKIPKGKHICHKCDNPPCVNPNHLFIGTHTDNMRDKVLKGRHIHGESHPLHKLKWKDILQIRKYYNIKNRNGGILARKYGVDISLIHRIIKKKTWLTK